MITHILALAILAHLDAAAPELQEPYKSRDACLAAAHKQNQTNPVVLGAAPALGVRFICLEIVSPDQL